MELLTAATTVAGVVKSLIPDDPNSDVEPEPAQPVADKLVSREGLAVMFGVLLESATMTWPKLKVTYKKNMAKLEAPENQELFTKMGFPTDPKERHVVNSFFAFTFASAGATNREDLFDRVMSTIPQMSSKVWVEFLGW